MAAVSYRFLGKKAPAKWDEALIADIVFLYRSAGWWSDGTSRQDRIEDMILGSFLFLAAQTRQGQTIGMGRVISDGVSDGYIQDVTVLPTWRGKGIGKTITRKLADSAKQKNLEWIGLVAEPGFTSFYEKLGFKAQRGFELMLYNPLD